MKPIPIPSFPVAVPIDPRIRRRRIEVRRVEGRRRLRFLIAILSVLLVSTGGWLTTRSPLLDVDAVHVAGAQQTPVDEVRRAAGLRAGLPMIDVDEGAVVARVEAVPWVDQARVNRQWPARVTISITERSPLVAAPDGPGAWWLLDRSGRALERVTALPAGLVAVEGLSGAAAAGAQVAGGEGALAVAAALSPEMKGIVGAVAVLEGGEIQLKLNSQGTVRLGAPAGVDAKLAAAEAVLAQVDVSGLAVLDVRLPVSPVLTRV